MYNYELTGKATNINPYLCDAPNVIITSRNRPLCDIPKMVYGNKPADGGNLIFEDEDYQNFIAKDPLSKSTYVPY